VILADRLLSQFQPQKDCDPRAFLTAIASIMMHYPIEIVEEVVDPFRGLPSRLKFMPTPYDVRQALDAAMPFSGLTEWEIYDARTRAQLAERAQLPPPPKKTMREIEDDCAARGIFMSGWKARNRTNGETPVSVRAKLGLTQEQWDAIPAGKPTIDDWKSFGEAATAVQESAKPHSK
jgi:hypothetical protein